MNVARRARYGRIDRMVLDLLATEPGGGGPPVSIERMIKAKGITVRRGRLDAEVSGLLVRHGETATIGVNAAQNALRQRFTLAHEFGHFLLHEGIVEHVDHGYRVNYRDSESALARDVEEIEANYFAASLLMPVGMLDAMDAVHAIDSDELVRDLAKRFQVSRHAMSLRLANVYSRYAPY